MMVQVPLLAGSWEERSPSVGGGSGRSLTPWLQLGTAGGFVNRLPQHPGDLQRLLSPFRPVTLRSTGGRGWAQELNPWADQGSKAKDLCPKCFSLHGQTKGGFDTLALKVLGASLEGELGASKIAESSQRCWSLF